jgi:EmrB/QacA subfamily drug resistance transporter
VERKWWTLVAVCTAIFMLLLDITVVNVALPKIAESLHASFTDLQWVIDAYALSLAVFVLTGGSLADLLGRRRVFAAGVALFTGASILCGAATTPLFLILARALQGIGGAIMFATSLALLSQAFRGRERGTAFGIWGATTGAAVAIGPLVGGALTDGLNWRWIFFVNIPIGIFTLVVAFTRVDESRNEGQGGIDWIGLVTLCGALFLLVYALLRGNDKGWTSGQILAELAGAVVLLLAFGTVELRQRDPMLDLRLFGNPAFAGAQITAFTLSAAAFSMFLYLTLYLQNVLGFTPLGAGLRFLPVTLLSFTVAPIAGKLSAHMPVRVLLAGGLLLVAGGMLLMRGLHTESTWTALLAGFILLGAGIGMVNPPLASTAIGVVDPRRAGMASGVNNTFRQVGIATGIAAFGALFQHRIQSELHVSSGGLRAIIAGHGEAARHAFVVGLNELFLVAAIVAFVGAVLAFALVRRRDFAQEPATQNAPA